VVNDFGHVLSQPWARIVLLLVFVEGALLYGSFVFVASYLHQHFDLSLSAAGGVVMLFGAGGFVFALASPLFVRALGEVGLVRWGGAAMMLALAALALARHWAWALPASLLLGLGFYMMHNTLQLNATQMAPERRGAAVAAFASSFFLGQSAGVSLAGWLVGHLGIGAVMSGSALGLLMLSQAFAGLRMTTRPRG
jgi:predicted MFS family arabinose efflux permease